MNDLYTVKEMATWLSDYLTDEGFETKIYSDLFLPARVPVYARRLLGEGNEELLEEIVVDIINSANTKDFFYTLHVSRTLSEEGEGMEIIDASSASFFRYYFPRAKVYWAYPDYLRRDGEHERFKALCKKNHIGLFEIGENKDNEDQVKKLIRPGFLCLISSLKDSKLQFYRLASGLAIIKKRRN